MITTELKAIGICGYSYSSLPEKGFKNDKFLIQLMISKVLSCVHTPQLQESQTVIFSLYTSSQFTPHNMTHFSNTILNRVYVTYAHIFAYIFKDNAIVSNLLTTENLLTTIISEQYVPINYFNHMVQNIQIFIYIYIFVPS